MARNGILSSVTNDDDDSLWPPARPRSMAIAFGNSAASLSFFRSSTRSLRRRERAASRCRRQTRLLAGAGAAVGRSALPYHLGQPHKRARDRRALFKRCRRRLRSRSIRRPLFRPGAFEFGNRACRPLAGSMPHGERSAPARAALAACEHRISGSRWSRISDFHSFTGCRSLWRIKIVMRRACGAYPRARSCDEARRIPRRCSAARLQSDGGYFPTARSSVSALPAFTKSLIAIR